MASEEETRNTSNYKLPSNSTMQHAVKFAIMEDRPIMLDYWADSLDKEVIIGKYENGEKVLVKNVDEYTSPIAKMFQVLFINLIAFIDLIIKTKKLLKSKNKLKNPFRFIF